MSGLVAVRVTLLDDDGNEYRKVGYGMTTDEAVANAEQEARTQYKRDDIATTEWVAA